MGSCFVLSSDAASFVCLKGIRPTLPNQILVLLKMDGRDEGVRNSTI
jgi:hypothetical protein